MSKWDQDVLFKCPCGREKYISLKNLKNTKSCGCRQRGSIVGNVLGFLTVIRLADGKDRHPTGVICRCVCGTEKCFSQGSLSSGKIISCGCNFIASRMNIKEVSFDPYDMSQPSPTSDNRYTVYTGARYRCREGGHKDYGGRGIKFLWNSFNQFCEDMGEKPEGYTLERLDVNGDYCKENCVWADWETQHNNKRNNVFVTVNGETKTITQWERYTGLYEGQVKERVKSYGWSLEDACSRPSKKRFTHDPISIKINGVTRTDKEWEKINGLRKGTVRQRISAGWVPEKACMEPVKTPKMVTALGMSKSVRDWERFHGLAEDTISARIRSGRWTEEGACSKGRCS